MICSINDKTVPEELRGKYQAFSLHDSAGVAHLRGLRSAGLTHIHLLPSYDYGSVPEHRQDQATIKVSKAKGKFMLFIDHNRSHYQGSLTLLVTCMQVI